MKKLSFLFIFLFIFGCDTNYKPNYQINNRKAPIIVIAIDTTTSSVIMRDGDNRVFTIYDNPTTHAITKSLIVGDTLRLKPKNNIIKNF